MQENPVDVLIVEDDVSQRSLLYRRLLELDLTVVQAEDAELGLRVLRQHRPHVVICDLLLPGMSGIELCRAVRGDSALAGVYFIMLTVCRDRTSRKLALDAGADDYLTKPCDPEELAARLRNGLRIGRLQDRLRRAALTDGLTGLWNHTQFREILSREFARTRRYGGDLALIMLDLDHFKAVNDTYGHEAGNEVLQQVAQHLVATVREPDVVARYGGEEFAVICPESDIADAAQLAQRICTSLPDALRPTRVPRLGITASLGVSATSDPAVTSVGDLIDRADYALYTGKHRGRNQVVRSDELEEGTADTGLQSGEVARLQRQVVSLSMQAKDLCLQSVWALVQALEARDRFTAWHSRNTTFYVNALAEAAGWSDPLRTAVANAAMLHDLGKIGVPDRILQSRRRLNERESAVLRQVPLITCKILEPLRVFETETLIIRHLRERYDGTGYPFGLAGRTIPVGSRLLAVAETFDALTSVRPHRRNVSLETGLERIAAEAGGQFDPQFTKLLAQVARQQRAQWEARIQRALDELRREKPLRANTSLS